MPIRKAGVGVVLAVLAVAATAGQASGCEFVRKFGGESSGAGHLSGPKDVAIDGSGNAWVADTAHNRVQKFNSSGEFVSQFGVQPVGTNSLTGIAIDSGGNVWVVIDTKVRKYKSSGELLSEFGSEGTGNGQFKNARDLSVDPSGNVWVVDSGEAGTAVRLQKFNSSGTYQSQFGKEGTGNGEFKSPEGIAIDSEGNILVADTGNNRY
ncbi:MAG TPA: hypothetical protein VF125_06295, partial [Solirubrobacterales bacterium]